MAQSSDPDADAVLASFDHPEASKDSDVAAVLASYDKQTPAESGDTLAMAPIGALEEFGKMGTGALAAVPAGLAYGGAAIGKAFGADVDPADVQRRTQNYFTYHPQSDSAKAAEARLAETYGPAVKAVSDAADRAATETGKVSPTAETFMRAAPGAFQAASAVTPLTGPAMQGASALKNSLVDLAKSPPSLIKKPLTIQETQQALDAAAANSPQSMGAAAAAPRLNTLPPELQQAVRNAVQKTGGAINPDVFARHAEAASLPVPMRLSEGQATQDPAIISHEMNNRGSTPQTIANLALQNRQLAENVQAIRDRVGPDVFSTNPVEHGDTLIQAYRDMDAPIRADISAKYKALEDANGGQFPLDGKAFTQAADAALAKKMKGRFLPSAIAGDLQDLRDGGPMTYETFENLRTNLAAEARKADRTGDGNAEAAVNIVRDSLESLPMTKETAAIKPLADAARSAAKARFDAIAADPAYKAVVNETVRPDDFTRKFIINGKRDDVATMRNNLSGNDTATQTMGVSAMDHLRDAAKIGPGSTENFSSAAFNKQLAALDPKLRSLVDPKTADQLSTLGNVARYTTNQPRGSFVNNSNTAVAMMAEQAAHAAEKLGNVAGGGIVPIGSMVRKGLENRAAAKQAEQSWAPGAGLTHLSDVAKK